MQHLGHRPHSPACMSTLPSITAPVSREIAGVTLRQDPWSLYKLQYTLYTVHTIVYILHIVNKSVKYTLYKLQFTMYTIQTICNVHYTLHNIQCIPYNTVQTTVYTLHITVWCIVQNVECAFSILCPLSVPLFLFHY